jgi:hypothetical protein
VASLLVFTGVATPADVVRAEPDLRPTYLAVDLRSGLLEPHPPVTRDDHGWTCGTATVTTEGELRGTGIDGLRVACVAAWSGDVDVEALATAVAAILT